GTWGSSWSGLELPRWQGITSAVVAALALLLEPELAIAKPPNASPIAAAAAASDATSLRLVKILCLRFMVVHSVESECVVFSLCAGAVRPPCDESNKSRISASWVRLPWRYRLG